MPAPDRLLCVVWKLPPAMQHCSTICAMCLDHSAFMDLGYNYHALTTLYSIYVAYTNSCSTNTFVNLCSNHGASHRLPLARFCCRCASCSYPILTKKIFLVVYFGFFLGP